MCERDGKQPQQPFWLLSILRLLNKRKKKASFCRPDVTAPPPFLPVRVRVSQLLPGLGLKAECSSLTFLFKGEVLRQVPALVVPTQEEECGGVVDLQRPEVENALREERRCVEASDVTDMSWNSPSLFNGLRRHRHSNSSDHLPGFYSTLVGLLHPDTQVKIS